MRNRINHSKEIEKIKLSLDNCLSESGFSKNTNEYTTIKLYILAIVATKYSSIDITFYQETLNLNFTNKFNRIDVSEVADLIYELIEALPFHSSYIIAVLAQEEEHITEKKSSGAFYTDYRLANYMLNGVEESKGLVLDPACGTGILLASYVLKFGANQKDIDVIIKNKICGADQSLHAITGAFISLSCLTQDKNVLISLKGRLRQCNSLIEIKTPWKDLKDEFHLIIANPPWEKLKVVKHDMQLKKDLSTIYGSSGGKNVKTDVSVRKKKLDTYLKKLNESYKFQGNGEKDLYVFFLELATKLIAKDGQISYLVPAGLIRSKGTENLREALFNIYNDIEISLFTNEPKYFNIDSRFKFLNIKLKKNKKSTKNIIKLIFAKHKGTQLIASKGVEWSYKELSSLRNDLTIPEVDDMVSLKLFNRLSSKGSFTNREGSEWNFKIKREVDMTQKRSLFSRKAKEGYLPLIEGRMVWHYNSMSKTYISGSGRAAKWEPCFFERPTKVETQFYFPSSSLDKKTEDHLNNFRIGFCDIAGQTNERSMMAAVIPKNYICGNKVPTVVFENDYDDNRKAYCWLAIVNSHTFDWLLRRVLTTTVNFFLLKSIPLPKMNFESELAIELYTISKRISNGEYDSLWERANLLTRVENLVVDAYGVSYKEFKKIIGDFPLLDRNQPVLPSENTSTITKDYLQVNIFNDNSPLLNNIRRRVTEAKNLNAIPFIPSSMNNIILHEQSI